MGTHLRVPTESYPMSTNMTGCNSVRKSLGHCALDESIALELEWLTSFNV